MGTRNVTAVFHEGKYKLAQYGQWDGYPEGQGATALDFLSKWTLAKMKKFKKALDRVRFVEGDEFKALWMKIGIVVADGFVTMEQSNAFNREYPYFTRDHGAKILGLVLDSSGEVATRNEISFVADSVMCEWAYVVDLDANTFEIFKGFNKKPLGPRERFASLPVFEPERQKNNPEKYYPCRRVAAYKLDDLPTERSFVKRCTPSDEDE